MSASGIITIGRQYRYHRLCKDSDQQWRDRLGGVFVVVGFAMNLTTLVEEIVFRDRDGALYVCSPAKFVLAFVPIQTEPVKEKAAGYVSESIHS